MPRGATPTSSEEMMAPDLTHSVPDYWGRKVLSSHPDTVPILTL